MIEGMAVFGATGGNPSGSRPNFFRATAPHLWQGRQGWWRFL